MPKKTVFYCAVSIGLLAGLVVALCNALQMNGVISTGVSLTFITFAYWSCYFLVGANPKGAATSWLSAIVGIAGAVLMLTLFVFFTENGLHPQFLALPLAVFCGVVVMFMAQLLPVCNSVPSIFMGAAIYFAVIAYPDAWSKGFVIMGLGLLLYSAIGFAAGFTTVKIVGYFNPAK